MSACASASRSSAASSTLEVVAEAEDGLEAADAAARGRPGVVLMDIRMPRLDGIGATRRIVARAADRLRVLMLTSYGLDQYVYEAPLAGASGFLLKDTPPEELVAAVKLVAAGEALLDPSVTRAVIEEFVRPPRPRRRDRTDARGNDATRRRTSRTCS